MKNPEAEAPGKAGAARIRVRAGDSRRGGIHGSGRLGFGVGRGRKVGPDQPVVVRAEVLAGDLAACGAFDQKAVLRRDLPPFRLPLIHSRLGHTKERSERDLRPQDCSGSVDWVKCFHAWSIGFLDFESRTSSPALLRASIR